MKSAAREDDNHYRMCKKIAQLTKVIYTLNCKTEDNEERTLWLQHCSEAEVAKLCKDYEDQIEQLHRRLGDAGAAAASAATTLEARHAELLQQAQRDFADRLNSVSKQLKEQSSAFDTTLAAAKQSFAAEVAAETGRVREAKDTEIAGLVREYNEKYNAMLTEQLDARDAMEAQLKTMWEKRLTDLTDQLAASKSSMGEELASHSRMLDDALKRNAVLSREHLSMEDQLTSMKAQLAQLESDKSAAESKLAAQLQSASAMQREGEEWKDRLGTLEAQVTALSAQIDSSAKALESEKLQVEKLKSQKEAIDNDKGVLETLNKKLEYELKELRESLASADAERKDLSAELQRLKSSTHDKESTLKDMDADLKAATMHLSEMEEQMQTLVAQHRKEVEQLRTTHAEAVRVAAEAARVAKEAHEADLAELRGALQSSLSSSQEKLSAEHAEKLRLMKQAHQEELDRLMAQNTTAQHSSASLTQELAAVQEELKRVQALLLDLQQQHATLQIDNLTETNRQREEMARLRQMLEEAQRNSSKVSAEQYAAMEAMQQKAVAELAALQKQHDGNLQQMERECAGRMEKAAREHEEAIQAMRTAHANAIEKLNDALQQQNSKLQSQLSGDRASLQATHASEMEKLRSAAQAAEDRLQSHLRHVERELQELKRTFDTLQSSAKAEADEQASQVKNLKAELHSLQDEHERAMRDLKSRTASELHNQLELLGSKHEATLKEMQQEHEAAVRSLQKDLFDVSEASKNREQNLEAAHSEKKTAMQLQFEQEKHDLERRLTAVHLSHLNEMQTAADEAYNKLQETLGLNLKALNKWQLDYKKQQDELRALEQKIEMMHHEAAVAKAAATAALNERDDEHQIKIQALHANHVVEMNRLAAMHKSALEDCAEQQTKERAAHDSLVQQLREAVKDLQHKYEYRESRPEDVELINKLLRENQEKESALLKAYSDMRLYKLELVNREENYNKVFNRQPVLADTTVVSSGNNKSLSLPVLSTRKHSNR